MAISVQEHSKLILSKIVGTFKENIEVKEGFSKWFPEETTPTLMVDVSVERDNDLIASDVLRFTGGNKSKASRTSEHKYKAPMYNQEYDFQKDEIYLNNISIAGIMGNSNVNRMIAQNALKNIENNRKMIRRAIMKQQCDVLTTGIATFKNADTINFRRKAESIVNVTSYSNAYWSSASTANPIDDISRSLKFLRNVGNSAASDIHVIMRDEALNLFLAADKIKSQGSNVVEQIQRINVTMPQFDGMTGFALHGRVAAGDFQVYLWTYNEKYTDDAGATKYYLDANKVIVLPGDFKGKTIFGGLPAEITDTIGGIQTTRVGLIEAKEALRSYYDPRTMSTTIELTSAPVVVPFSIDRVYTMQVTA